MQHCIYEKIGYISGTKRVRYQSECGLDVVQMDHVKWDGIEYVKKDIEGVCMKCKKEIKIKS